ncbi:ribonuclease VapC [Candidatus Woesearchaeota archaeon]|nr:ribonuclease VapC [Candidatus Woesearchaeota archaeon]
MKTIIVDTNFLIYCAKFKIDFFSEIDRLMLTNYKIVTLNTIIEELEKVKPKELKLIKRFLEKVEIIKTNEKKVDKELQFLSSKDFIIATQDRELKQKLKGPKIIIRQKKYLELK